MLKIGRSGRRASALRWALRASGNRPVNEPIGWAEMFVTIDVPDLEEFPDGFPQYWVGMVFMNTGSHDFQVATLTTSYVRLVEVALIEYRLAKEALHQYWKESSSIKLSALNRAISHFESCLSDMHRAIQFFRRLRRNKNTDRTLQNVLKELKPEFATDRVADRIGEFRNAVHHLDEKIVGEEVKQGDSTALMPDGPETPHPTDDNQTNKNIDRLVIGNLELLFSDLTEWLREMASAAEIIANYHSKAE